MIQFELIEGVGKITLNRPEKYHSFVREMALKLQDTLDKCNDDPSITSILITATGKAFCAGTSKKNLDVLAATATEKCKIFFKRSWAFRNVYLKILRQKPTFSCLRAGLLQGCCRAAWSCRSRWAVWCVGVVVGNL